MENRINKIRAYAKAMTGRLIVADQKIALLDPIRSDGTLIKKWDDSFGAHGLELLRVTLFLDLIRELASISIDKDERSPSITNVLQLLEANDLLEALKEEYIKPLPSNWIGDVDPDSRAFWEEKHKERQLAENKEKFDGHHLLAKEKYSALEATDLYTRVKKARNKIVAHYEMRHDGEVPRILEPSDIGLKWGDVSEFYEALKPIVLELQLLISSESYALDLYREEHDKVAKDFWSK